MKLALVAALTLVVLNYIRTAHAQEGTFVNVRPVEGIDSETYDFGPTVSSDGLEIIFTSFVSGGQGSSDLWWATRPEPDAPFGTPQNLTNLNTSQAENAANLSVDGLELFFERGAGANTDLLIATRNSTGDSSQFQIMRSLDELNTPSEERWPTISADGRKLYFQSNRDGTYALYVAERASADANAIFGEPALVCGIPSENQHDNGPDSSISGSGLTLFFTPADGEIWRANRATEADCFGPAFNLGLPVNTDVDDGTPFVSSDWPAPGSKLYFARAEGTIPTGSSSIWEATWVPADVEPELSIKSAVILSWPVTGEAYLLEGAASVNGPWETIEAEVVDKNGNATVVVEAAGEVAFFRLREVETP